MFSSARRARRPSGSISIGSGAATSGKVGVMSITVGSGNSGAGGLLTVASGQSTGLTGGAVGVSSGWCASPRPAARSRSGLRMLGDAGVSGVLYMSSGTTSSGSSGSISIGSGAATAGKAGVISITVGSGNSGAGGPVTVASGQSTGDGRRCGCEQWSGHRHDERRDHDQDRECGCSGRERRTGVQLRHDELWL